MTHRTRAGGRAECRRATETFLLFQQSSANQGRHTIFCYKLCDVLYLFSLVWPQSLDIDKQDGYQRRIFISQQSAASESSRNIADDKHCFWWTEKYEKYNSIWSWPICYSLTPSPIRPSCNTFKSAFVCCEVFSQKMQMFSLSDILDGETESYFWLNTAMRHQ